MIASTRRTSAHPLRPTTYVREVSTRLLITVVVLGLVALFLASSKYRWNFEPAWRYRMLFEDGLYRTLAAAGLAFSIGLVLGLGVAMARLSRSLWIRHLGDMYVEIIRGTPVLVQISIAYFGFAPLLGINDKFLVGAVALGIFAAAYSGEIFRAGIESVERGQIEAARSLGLTRGRTLLHVVLPQAFKRMIPPLTGEMIAITKETSLLYFIGLMELMSAAKQVGAHTYRTFEALLVVACLYLTITIPLSLLARWLERRLGRTTVTGAHL